MSHTANSAVVPESDTPGPMLRLRVNSPTFVHQATAHLYVMPRVRRTCAIQGRLHNLAPMAPRWRILLIVLLVSVVVIADEHNYYD